MSKEKTEKISFYKLFKRFPDEEAAHRFFAERQWGKDEKNRFCPHCGGIRTTRTNHRMPYHCKDCRKRFSVRTGTILAESNISLHKWLMAMYLLNTNLKGVPSTKLARDLDITQKTAWFLAHRIRKAFEDQQEAKFVSDVEVDETYMGGKVTNMHKSKKPRLSSAGTQDKTPVIGIRERATGKVKAKVTNTVSSITLQNAIQESVEEGSMVYTDQNRGYKNIVKKNYRHSSVNHSAGEYIKGMAHTNGVESFWSMLKRGHMGVYHQMSKKHLQRYIDEYAGRHNIRPLATMEQIETTFDGMKGKRLKYKELIN